MKPSIPLISASLVAVLSVLLVSGCATHEPLYRDATQSGALPVPKGKALIILYKAPGVAGVLARYKAYANGQPISEHIAKGTFATYEAEPGLVHVSSSRTATMAAASVLNPALFTSAVMGAIGGERLVIDVSSGETYYLEMYMGWSHEEIKWVSKEEGQTKIKECRWLNPPGK